MPELIKETKSQKIYVEKLIKINLENWYKNRIVLIGDAAHGFEAFAGIGGSMALEDAYVLSEELIKNDFSTALAKYQLRRKPRVKLAAKEAEKLREWKISKSSLVIELEKIILPFIPLNYFAEEYIELMDSSA